jgi:membrane peptidoglycan carboxypeptidase
MEFLKRLLFFIAAASFLVIVLTLTFSLFLIIWPFVAIGVMASIAYAWLSKNIRPKNGDDKPDTTIYRSDPTIIEHDEKKKD